LQEKTAWEQEKTAREQEKKELTEDRDGYKESRDEAMDTLNQADEDFANGEFSAVGLQQLGKLIRNQLKDAANKDIEDKVHDDLDKYVVGLIHPHTCMQSLNPEPGPMILGATCL
jgi:hypothetical protein